MWKNVFRWILVFPLGLIVGILLNLLALFFLNFGWQIHGEPFFFKDLILGISRYSVFTIGFIITGILVAPNYKKKTAVILTILICSLSILSIIFNIIDSTFMSISTASNLASFISAFFIYFYLKEKGLYGY